MKISDEKILLAGGPPGLAGKALAGTPLFADWPPALVAQLADASTARSYPRGAYVATGAGLERQALLVVSGVIELSHAVAIGRRFLLRLVAPGQITGLIRFFDDAPVDCDYTAREASKVIHIPCETLRSTLDSHVALWPAFVRDSLEGSSSLLRSVLDQVIVGSAEQRVAATLHRLGALFGVQGNAGLRLRMRLSQDDLADMLCVSRQTVNKELKRMEAARIVVCNYSAITIIDSPALAQLAEGRVD